MMEDSLKVGNIMLTGGNDCGLFGEGGSGRIRKKSKT